MAQNASNNGMVHFSSFTFQDFYGILPRVMTWWWWLAWPLRCNDPSVPYATCVCLSPCCILYGLFIALFVRSSCFVFKAPLVIPSFFHSNTKMLSFCPLKSHSQIPGADIGKNFCFPLTSTSTAIRIMNIRYPLKVLIM